MVRSPSAASAVDGLAFDELDFNVSPADGFDVWEIGHATYGQFDAFPLAY